MSRSLNRWVRRFRPTRGTVRGDDAAFESRLVWIFGSPRSGSTWLLDLLVHPLAPSDDPPTGAKRLEAPDADEPSAVPINEPYIPQHLTPPLFAGQAVSDGLAAITLNEMRRGSPSYFLSDAYEDAWRPALRGLLLARLHAQVSRAQAEFRLRDPLVVIKEPNGSLGAELILSLLPRSRLIFLLRDGRDVVDSMIDALAPGSWLERPAGGGHEHDFAEERLSLVHHESVMWLARTEAVERAFDAHPPALRQLVRYEDARRDPASVLESLDSWLGLRRSAAGRASALRWNDFDSVPAEAKGPGMPLRAAQPGLWRENLTPAEQQVMDELMGAKLEELGYARPAPTAPPAAP